MDDSRRVSLRFLKSTCRGRPHDSVLSGDDWGGARSTLRLGLGLGLGLGLVAFGNIGVRLSNRNNLSGIGIVGGKAEVHVDEGSFAGRPRDHFGTKADLKGVNNFCGGESVKLFMGEEGTGSRSNGFGGCLGNSWLGLLGGGGSKALRLTRFTHDGPANVGGGLVGGWVIEGGDRWG